MNSLLQYRITDTAECQLSEITGVIAWLLENSGAATHQKFVICGVRHQKAGFLIN